MIVAGYAGIGKTTFCKEHTGEALDLVCMPFKYLNFYEVSGKCREDEGIKAHGDLELRVKWELYYYWAIKYLFQHCPEKYIIIPTVRSVMPLLDADDIPYTVVYPDVELKDEYEERYRRRGDSQNFLNVFIDGWEYMLEDLDKYGDKQIVLKRGQYLSDVISCNTETDETAVRDFAGFERCLLCENPRSRLLRQKKQQLLEEDGDQIHGIFYYQPKTENDVIDDFVCVDSRADLKLLLEQDRSSGSREPVFCMLSTEQEDGKIKYKEVVFRGDELRKMKYCI